jgi:hypothetical protein
VVVPRPPDERDGLSGTKRPSRLVPPGTEDSLSDRARARLRAQEEHLRVCAELNLYAPLDLFYRRPLRTIPLGQFLTERWWGAA